MSCRGPTGLGKTCVCRGHVLATQPTLKQGAPLGWKAVGNAGRSPLPTGDLEELTSPGLCSARAFGESEQSIRELMLPSCLGVSPACSGEPHETVTAVTSTL